MNLCIFFIFMAFQFLFGVGLANGVSRLTIVAIGRWSELWCAAGAADHQQDPCFSSLFPVSDRASEL